MGTYGNIHAWLFFFIFLFSWEHVSDLRPELVGQIWGFGSFVGLKGTFWVEFGYKIQVTLAPQVKQRTEYRECVMTSV